MKPNFYTLTAILVFFFQHAMAGVPDTAKATTKIFVRIYNSTNAKIGKGYLIASDDSTRIYVNHHGEISFPVQEVAYIKTRRSALHPVLMGTAIGFGTSFILAAASNASDNAGNGEAGFDLALAAVAAPVIGVVSGSLAAAFRKRDTYHIDGSSEKWLTAKAVMLSGK